MSSSYYNNLIRKVIDASEANTWEDAVREWVIVDCEEDEECSSACICGKESIRFLYTIRNYKTGRVLYPIGSSCIRKFERDDLDEEITILEGKFRLYRAIRNGEKIELTSKFFSKKLLAALNDDGAFPGNQYNHFDGYEDYEFLLDMFNKRDKSRITDAQQRKINGIIAFSIKPYLSRTLKFKDDQYRH